LNLKNELRKLLRESGKDREHSYGCAMASLAITKGEWDKVQSLIEDDELYTEEEGHGRELEPHVTILYGLHKKVKDDELKEVIEEWDSFPVELKTVGLFENDKFDVVKFSITSSKLNKYNKELREFPHTNNYPDYKAHATIAYVKPGKGKEIIKRYKDFEGLDIECLKIKYSKADKSNKYYNLKIK
jgi:2'-5' RNA ligase